MLFVTRWRCFYVFDPNFRPQVSNRVQIISTSVSWLVRLFCLGYHLSLERYRKNLVERIIDVLVWLMPSMLPMVSRIWSRDSVESASTIASIS